MSKSTLIVALLTFIYCTSSAALTADRDSLAIVQHIERADDYIMKKKYDSARFFHDKAVKLLVQSHFEILEIYANNIFGQILSRTGNNNEAINYYQDAIKAAESKQDTAYMIAAARIYGNIGGVYYFLKKFEKAYQYATKGYEISKRARLDDAAGMFQMQMGLSLSENGDYKDALPLLKRSIDFYRENPNPYLLEMGYVNLGELYYHTDSLDQAENTLRKAISLRQEYPQLNNNSTAHAMLAKTAQKRNNLDEALEFARRSLEISTANKRPIKQLDAYEVLYSIYEQMGNYELAYRYRNHFIFLNDSLISSETIQKIAELETKYETEKKEKEIQQARLEIERTNRFQTFLLVLIVVIIIFSLISVYQTRQKFHLRQQLLSHEIDNLRLQINALVGKEIDQEVELHFEALNQKLNNPLSDREFEVLKMALGDNNNQAIAASLSLSVNTVKFHLKNIYEKLGVSNRKEALQFVIRE